MTDIKRIPGRTAEIGGGISIQRFLPQRQQRMIGPWCFLDHAGPAGFVGGQGMHVGAHPHIGLQTFTWMLEGEVLHTDSLGNQQIIRPGQVNLMTAGHGISHTEDNFSESGRLHAAQLWIALPADLSDIPASFQHCPDLPVWREGELSLSLLAGEYQGRRSPCRVYSPLLGLDLQSENAGSISLQLEPRFEYGLLALRGSFSFQDQQFDGSELLYLAAGQQVLELDLAANSQILLIGGEAFPEPVQMWWNFVAYDKATLIQAAQDWQAGDARFGQVAKPDAVRLQAPAMPWR